MTAPRTNAHAAEDQSARAPRSGALAAVLALPRAIADRVRRRPLSSAIALALVVGVVLAAGVTAARMSPKKPLDPATLPPSLTDALAALDSGDIRKATSIAKKLEAEQTRLQQSDGGPLFVLGAVAAIRAREATLPQTRRELSLRAVRRLQQANDLGFPEGRAAQGYGLLAESLQRLARPAQSIAPLEAGLAAGENSRLLLLRAAAKRELEPCLLRESLADVEAAIAAGDLPADLAIEARLDQCKLQALLGNIAEAKAALAASGVEATNRTAQLLTAWLMIRQGDNALGLDEAGRPTKPLEERSEASSLYRAALAEIETAAGGSGKSHDESAAADYLSGLAWRRLAQCESDSEPLTTAIEWLARSRQVYEDRAEGLAAAWHEADALRQQQSEDEALAAWKRLAERMGDSARGAWPYLTTDQMRAGMRKAWQDWVAAGRYDAAAKLADVSRPLFSAALASEMKAIALRDGALASEKAIAAAKQEDRAAAMAESRKRWREAGDAQFEMASLRKSSRDYPQQLYNSAQSQMAGHDYHRAVVLLNEYLVNERGPNRPPGLIALCEAQLSLGDYDAAITAALEVLEFFGRHPLCYRARLLAGQAYEEQEKYAEAKAMLEENLYGGALTPASPDWRDSLFALGGMFYRQGARLEAKSHSLNIDDSASTQFPEAMLALEQSYNAFGEASVRLAEAVAPERYPKAPQATAALYMLAEAHRQRAKLPKRRLQDATVEAVRDELEKRLREDLLAAVSWYDALRARFDDAHEEGELVEIDQAMERNTWFHRADALFDLADYEAAVKAYYSAANRYHDSPAALEAFVQIAACQRRLGRFNEAKGTLNQAKIALSRMPEADFATVTRYNREEWAQLLNRLGGL